MPLYVILPDVLKLIKQRIGPVEGSFNLSKLRKDIGQLHGTSIDHSATFEGVQRRCVKIPRVLVPEEILTAIDAACGAEVREQEQQSTKTNNGGDNQGSIKEKLESACRENESLSNERKDLKNQLHQEKLKYLAAEEEISKSKTELAAAKKELGKVMDRGHANNNEQEHPDDSSPMCTQVATAFLNIVGNEKENPVHHHSSTEENADVSMKLPKQGKRPAKHNREVRMLQDPLHKGIVQGKRHRKNSK